MVVPKTGLLLCIALLLLLRLYGQQFPLQEPANKPFRVSGSLAFRYSTYHSSNDLGAYPSNNIIISGTPRVNLLGVNIPLAITYSNQQADFRQAFNQFGVSPTYKWITLHGGFRNLYYSKYTMAGYQLYGGGIELTPGNWKFAACYGRLNRSTGYDTTGITTPVAYERKGFAGLIRYGRRKGYIALSFMKAKDDSSSLPDVAKYYATNVARTTPSENLVVGLAFKMPLIIKNLSWETETGVSVYTQDISANFGIDTSALKSHKQAYDFISKLIHVNITSNYFTAVESKLNYYHKKGLNTYIQYKRIDPNFKSMGAYFFQNDVQHILYGLSFPMFKNKLRYNGTVGKQNDNLNNIKLATSVRWITSSNLSYYDKVFSCDVSFYNYANTQKPNIQRFADSLRITQTTQTINVSPRFNFRTKNLYHRVGLQLGTNSVVDDNPSLRMVKQERKLDTKTAGFNYNLSVPSVNFNLSTNVNYTDLTDHAGYAYNSYGINIGVTKGMLKEKLVLTGNGGIYSILQSGERTNNYSASLVGSYILSDKFKVETNVLYSNAPAISEFTFMPTRESEIRTDINLIYSF